MQLLVFVGVHHGEKLHRPLDVRERAPPQFGVSGLVRAAWQAFLIHARLHPSHLPDRRIIDASGGIADRIDELDEGAADLLVTGDVSGPKK